MNVLDVMKKIKNIIKIIEEYLIILRE